jgi:broad specificity phosphatase PhoE
VTEVVRLTFVSHAMTDAMAGGRFATDEPLNATGRRQVALDAPPKSFWHIDIAPVSRTVMHFRGHAWTLRSAF